MKRIEIGWTFDDVEERLIAAQRAWWRCEGGRWPFASDGPWWLVARDLYGPDVDKDVPPPRRPLSRAEIARRDEAVAWLKEVAEADRRIVVLAVAQLASGRARVRWSEVKARIGLGMGARGVGMRYRRAIGGIARRLSDAGVAAAA